MIKGLCENIDPALFDSAAGMLEDLVQASASEFIHIIKVSAVAHGIKPLRVAGVSIMPDQEATAKKSDGKETFSGKCINSEMVLIYRAWKMGTHLSSHSNDAQLEMQFLLVLQKGVTFPLPILRLCGHRQGQIAAHAGGTFIKNVIITFLGLVRVQVEIVPLQINLSSNLVLSGFVQEFIDVAMAEYWATSSLTFDFGEIFMGDEIKR